MAFERQQPILELQYLDASGSKGTVLMKAPLGTAYEDMDVSAEVLTSIIAPITGAVLIRQRVIFKAIAVPRAAADDSSPILRSGMFFFENDDGTHQTVLQVPSLLDSVLETTEPGAGVLIDTSNSDVVSFVSAALELPIVDPFGNMMASLITAYRQSRT